MPMNRQTIEYLERLARIELTPDEKERLARELGRIIDYAGELAGVDTRGIPSTTAVERSRAAVGQDARALRPDEPGVVLDRRDVLDGAPDKDKQERLFRVPRVIEK